MPPLPRRTRLLRINGDWFIGGLCRMGWGRMYEANDIPDDLRLVGMALDYTPNVVLLLVESQSFDEVPEGAAVPEWHPNVTTYSPVELPNGDLLFDAAMSGRKKAVASPQDA
jgi:hypothetical protein